MSDDSETVEDTKKRSLEMDQEPADENDNGDSHCYVKQEPDNEYETEGPCFPVHVSSMLSSINIKPQTQH